MTELRKTDFLIEVAKGNIPKHSLVHKFGASNIGTTLTPVTVSQVYNTPTAAVSLEIVSSSAADAQDDIGAHEYIVQGLDANWNLQTQTVSAHATDGTTAVAVSGTWLRVFRWYVSQSGTYATASAGSHQGTLTLRVSGGGATWSQLGISPIAIGQSQIGAYTIPTGHTGYLLTKNIFVDSIKTVDFYFFQRPNAHDVSSPYTGTMRLVQQEIGVTSGFELAPRSPKGGFTGPCDIGFLAQTSTGTADIAVEFEILLVED